MYRNDYWKELIILNFGLTRFDVIVCYLLGCDAITTSLVYIYVQMIEHTQPETHHPWHENDNTITDEKSIE